MTENNPCLTRENLANICRLCHKLSRFSISIFDRVDPNPNKKCFKDRILEMYSIKVSATDGLPTNICHRCLYLAEMYTDFRESVRQCEIRLQNFVTTSCSGHTSKPPLTERTANGESTTLNSDDSVTVIDPDQDYQSTDEESSTSDIENSTASLPTKQDNAKVNRFKTQQIKNVFFCEYCDKAFVTQEECFRHERNSHGQPNPHICTFCTFSCASRNTIIAHIKECHDPKPFLCTQCDKKFGRRSDLRKHSVVHTGIRPFRCQVCNKNFSRNTNLTKHMRIHEKMQYKRDDDPQSVNSSLIRNFTENMVISLDPFNDHDSYVDDENHHAKTMVSRGNHTINQSASTSSTAPQNNHHINPEAAMTPTLPPIHMSLPNPINIPAPKPSIPVPIQSIEPIEIEPEPETSISLLFKGSLPSDSMAFSRHVTGDAVTFVPNRSNKEPVIKPKTFACDQCPKKFATQSSLLNHRSIHLDIRSHVCTVCNKSFIKKRELDRHSTIHTTNRPFECSTCPKKFGRKDKLIRHEKTHLEFFCPKCNLVFNRKDGLLSHMKVHDGNETQPEMLNPALRTKNEMFSSIMKPRNDVGAPMNLVVSDQQKLNSMWPNLDLHDAYMPFQ